MHTEQEHSDFKVSFYPNSISMMWSFKEQRYVPADEYFEIDGDCRLAFPHQTITNDAESLGSGVMGMPNRDRLSCPGDVWE